MKAYIVIEHPSTTHHIHGIFLDKENAKKYIDNCIDIDSYDINMKSHFNNFIIEEKDIMDFNESKDQCYYTECECILRMSETKFNLSITNIYKWDNCDDINIPYNKDNIGVVGIKKYDVNRDHKLVQFTARIVYDRILTSSEIKNLIMNYTFDSIINSFRKAKYYGD